MAAHLPGQWHFYWHGYDFCQQAPVKSRHEGGGVVVWVDQRHLRAEGDRRHELEVVDGWRTYFKLRHLLHQHHFIQMFDPLWHKHRGLLRSQSGWRYGPFVNRVLSEKKKAGSHWVSVSLNSPFQIRHTVVTLHCKSVFSGCACPV